MRLSEFFYFHKSDRIAIVFLAVATIFFAIASVLSTKLGDGFFVSEEEAAAEEKAAAEDAARQKKGGGETYYVEGTPAELFRFDPNTADSTALLRLGLKPWMVRNIYKYRAAGGVFRSKEDFAQVYGLTLKQYKALEPYITISDDYLPAADFYPRETRRYGPQTGLSDREAGSRASAGAPRDTLMFPYKLKPGQRIALNTADTTQLKKVPGIGSGYAKAIVNRRERLGGFYSAEQLLEIDGLPAEALPYLSVQPEAVRRLNVNKATYAQMRRHPYINFYQARDIVNYRRTRGDLKSLSELSFLPSFTKEDIARLSHYLDF